MIFTCFTAWWFGCAEGARASLSLAGTMLGFYPVRVLPSKTAIAPVNPTFLPRVRLIIAIYWNSLITWSFWCIFRSLHLFSLLNIFYFDFRVKMNARCVQELSTVQTLTRRWEGFCILEFSLWIRILIADKGLFTFIIWFYTADYSGWC